MNESKMAAMLWAGNRLRTLASANIADLMGDDEIAEWNEMFPNQQIVKTEIKNNRKPRKH